MSNTRPRTALLGIALAVAGLIAAVLVPSTSAGAAPATVSVDGQANASAARNYYGAIALAFTGGAYGWSKNYSSKRAALRVAQKECKNASSTPSSCRKIAWVANGCLSVAVRWNGNNVARYGWAYRRSKSAATFAAINECGGNCRKRVTICSKG